MMGLNAEKRLQRMRPATRPRDLEVKWLSVTFEKRASGRA